MEPEKKSTFGLIYFLSEKKLTMLRNYLDENLKKKISDHQSFQPDILFFLLKKKMAHIDYISITDSWIMLLLRTVMYFRESMSYSIECKEQNNLLKLIYQKRTV